MYMTVSFLVVSPLQRAGVLEWNIHTHAFWVLSEGGITLHVISITCL